MLKILSIKFSNKRRAFAVGFPGKYYVFVIVRDFISVPILLQTNREILCLNEKKLVFRLFIRAVAEFHGFSTLFM